jgi:ceramide glucosyltransferase
MSIVVSTVFVIAALIAVGKGLALALQTWEHRRLVRNNLPWLDCHRPNGHAVVLVPCKGVDVDLEANLRAILEQDYWDYEVRFAVESTDDPACQVIRRVMACSPWVPARLIVAGIATHTGQKNHNLRRATADLGSEVRYLAFADSDAQPRREWLRLLVARLAQPGTLAATGYRWFIPARASLGNSLLYSINCGVMMLLGRQSYHMVWGGSWAIRRETFDRLGLRAAWRGTLSDDLVASRLLRQAKIAPHFEPAAVVASPLNVSLAQMFSFLRRQYLIARFYAPRWWAFGLAILAVTQLASLALLGVLCYGGVTGAAWTWLPALMLIAEFALSVGRGALRQSLRRVYFPNDAGRTRVAAWFDVLLGPLACVVNLAGLTASAAGQRILWRGLYYRILRGGRVELQLPPGSAVFQSSVNDAPSSHPPVAQPQRPLIAAAELAIGVDR